VRGARRDAAAAGRGRASRRAWDDVAPARSGAAAGRERRGAAGPQQRGGGEEGGGRHWMELAVVRSGRGLAPAPAAERRCSSPALVLTAPLLLLLIRTRRRLSPALSLSPPAKGTGRRTPRFERASGRPRAVASFCLRFFAFSGTGSPFLRFRFASCAATRGGGRARPFCQAEA
jgi:hypothetical protein